MSRDKVVCAIKEQHNKRAVGLDLIPGELLKYGGDELQTLVWELFVRIWEEELVPTTFKLLHIRALYKNKGDRSDCNFFRGISLLSVPGKVFARVLLNRLRILKTFYRKCSLVSDQTGGIAKQSSKFGSCRRKAENNVNTCIFTAIIFFEGAAWVGPQSGPMTW